VPPVAGTPQWVASTNINGFTIWTLVMVGARAGYWDPPPTLVSPAKPAVWNPPNSGPYSGPVGIWIDQARGASFAVLHCPSDPTLPANGILPSYWGSTSYLANWNAWGDSRGDGSSVMGPWTQYGFWSPPQPFTNIRDGLSNTVLFAEGYSVCDSVERIALYSWYYHSFGLTPSLQRGQLDPKNGVPSADCPYGMPNTFMFQSQPRPLPYGECPAGADCCSRWKAQTPHAAMNVALLDGSVRSVLPSVSQQTWNYLLLPRDNHMPGDDW
jgi:hypothetical protein